MHLKPLIYRVSLSALGNIPFKPHYLNHCGISETVLFIGITDITNFEIAGVATNFCIKNPRHFQVHISISTHSKIVQILNSTDKS